MNGAWDDMVLVGTIARAHGLRGNVIVQPETDFPDERFRPGARVYLEPREASDAPRALTVEAVQWHLGRLLVSFAECGSIDAAEALGHGELRVPPDQLVALASGRFYHHDLVGCVVVTEAGMPVGTVRRVEGSGGASTLVVQGRRGEVLVPLAAEICVDIDVGGRRIVVAPPEGLLDLNVSS